MKIRPGISRLLLLTFLLFQFMAGAQTPVKNYSLEWKKADALIAKRLPQSALTEVKKIYHMARRDGQEAQQVKCLVVMTGLQAEFRDDYEGIAIKDMEAELA